MISIIDITRDRVLDVLSRHIGAENAVHISELVREITRFLATPEQLPALERRTRTLIEQLRNAGAHICAHPRCGYYMAATPDELDATCEFLYSRAMASLKQIAAMKKVSLPDLRGQLHLPT